MPDKIYPITIDGLEPIEPESEVNEELKKGLSILNMDKLTKATENQPSIFNVEIPEESKPKRGRPKKTVTANTESDIAKDVKTPMNSNMPYFTTYSVPTQILTHTAMEIDELSSKIKQDLDLVRASKSMRKKYDYITTLSGNLGQLYANKISVARELANEITNSHRLELNKHKELSATVNEDDDKRIADMFNAFVNAPMGMMPVANRTTPAQFLNMPTDGIPVSAVDGNLAIMDDEAGYNHFMNNLTPAQQSMMRTANPNIETVLVYDQTTHAKWFEVIDTRTGATIPNAELPAQFVLDGCIVDVRNGIARNSQLNKTYKLKLVGTRLADEF